MSRALYRKYRSRSLDEVLGQDHVTSILRRALEKGKIAHAYLLTGPRGVGKTSIARILAHEINQLPYQEDSTHLDIIEIDAASNNSVEDVRDLRDKVQIAPVSAKFKVYIIDEVHMLSKQAFNALLKTLEEPPEHIVFILATTDADKLPATIISRVQRFNFRPISPDDAVKHLGNIAKQEGIDIDAQALQLIAAHGKGSFRDSISLLDQIQHLSDGKITHAEVVALLGLADTQTVADILSAYDTNDTAAIIELVDSILSRGTPPAVITDQLITTIRAQISEHPERLKLLDSLLDVYKSPWPEVKLLTALTSEANLAAPPITPPAKKASKSSPQKAPKEQPKPETPAKKPKPQKTAPAAPFEWEAFLHAVKPNAAGAYIILSKCGHQLENGKLTIFAGKKFNKSKLDKALPELNAAISELGSPLEIEILGTPKPPEDETTANILAMMGGGEEISA